MDATFYAQIEPSFYRRYRQTDAPRLHSIQATRITQKRPAKPMPGCVVVKLTVRIPDAAFLPLAPEAVIEIPLAHTEPILVESQAVDLLPED